MRTQVAIIGGGPAGLLLSHMLHLEGIESVVLEKQTREYVMKRIRAGLLEAGTVQLLRDVGLGKRMDKIGNPLNGSMIYWRGRSEVLIDTLKYTGKLMMAYSQTRITEDLYEARERDGGIIIDEAKNARPHDLTTEKPYVTYEKDGKEHRIDCDFVAGCDGFHGISRSMIPASIQKIFEREYPFGWLGVIAEVKPFPTIAYANNHNGYALASQRGPRLARYYVQCSMKETVEDWPDERVWDHVLTAFPEHVHKDIETGPTIDKTIAPLRSFVSEPMQYGRLFLAGDAAHTVPPTGAKGLNTAVGDVFYLQRAFINHYKKNDDHYLNCYSEMALRRVWGVQIMSWRLTRLLHALPEDGPFEQRAREEELDYLARSEHAMASLAEQYVGLPYEA